MLSLQFSRKVGFEAVSSEFFVFTNRPWQCEESCLQESLVSEGQLRSAALRCAAQVLMAWQDPNKVPIKAFYEGVTNASQLQFPAVALYCGTQQLRRMIGLGRVHFRS